MWLGNGSGHVNDHIIYYSDNQDCQHKHGMGIMINRSRSRYVLHFLPLSNRVMMLQLNTNIRTMNMIKLFASTLDKEEQEVEYFYD